MKIAIVYFSRTGNTGFIANIIREQCRESDTEIFHIPDDSPRGIKGFIKCCIDSFHEKTSPCNLTFDPEKYDFVFFGCPVWAHNIPPVVRGFFNRYDFSARNMALFCTAGSMNHSALKNVRNAAELAHVYGTRVFVKPLENPKSRADVSLWVHSVIEAYKKTRMK